LIVIFVVRRRADDAQSNEPSASHHEADFVQSEYFDKDDYEDDTPGPTDVYASVSVLQQNANNNDNNHNYGPMKATPSVQYSGGEAFDAPPASVIYQSTAEAFQGGVEPSAESIVYSRLGQSQPEIIYTPLEGHQY
jgi:hypothetical protein